MDLWLCIHSLTWWTMLYKWQVFFHTVDEGKYCYQTINHYLDQLLPSSGYHVCPGIMRYPHETIRFQTKNLREWGIPFTNRVDSKLCELWHVPSNVHHPAGETHAQNVVFSIMT